MKQSNRRRVKIDKRKRSSFSQKPLSRRFGWCLHVRTSSRVLYKATAHVAYPSAALFRVIFFSSHWPGWLPWTASRAMCIVTIKTLLYPLLGDNHGHSKRPKLKGIVNFTHAKKSFELCDRLILTDSASGGTPFCKPYRYVPPQKVWVLRRFGLKTGIKTFSILVWNRVWYRRNHGSVWTY